MKILPQSAAANYTVIIDCWQGRFLISIRTYLSAFRAEIVKMNRGYISTFQIAVANSKQVDFVIFVYIRKQILYATLRIILKTDINLTKCSSQKIGTQRVAVEIVAMICMRNSCRLKNARYCVAFIKALIVS